MRLRPQPDATLLLGSLSYMFQSESGLRFQFVRFLTRS